MTATPDLRRQILDASVALIAHEGLAALSVREVARRAGVSHQAPYHYFADREAILAALAEEGFAALEAELVAARAAPGDAMARLSAGGRAYVQVALTRPAHFRVMFRPELVDLDRYPSARAHADGAFAALEALVADLVGEGALDAGDAADMVVLSWSVAHGLAGLLLDGPLAKAMPGAGAADAVMSLLGALVRGGGSSGRARGGGAEASLAPRKRASTDGATAAAPAPRKRASTDGATAAAPAPRKRASTDGATAAAPAPRKRASRDGATAAAPAPRKRASSGRRSPGRGAPRAR